MTAPGRVATSEEPSGADRSGRAALAVFVAYLVGGSLVVLLHLGRDRWFFSDEWTLIAGREPGAFESLFRANNAHWTTLPAVAYDVMWRLFGIRSYVPYQAMSVATHALVVVLVRLVMRRAGVSPWWATVACAPIVIFGAGSDNLVWAFQITNTGAVALGLVQLLLADREGPIDRRDALGLLAGLGALMCSGAAVALVVSVGLAVLVRRGWRPALLHTVPLAAAYGIWAILADPQSGSPAGRPSVGTLVRWLARFVEGTFTGLGGAGAMGVAFAVVLVAGVGLAVADSPWADARRRLAAPGALAVGALVFSASTALGRWHLGTVSAAGSRYVYIGGVLVLPLLAVGVQAIADRWRPAGVVLGALLLLAVPLGIGDFGDPLFGEAYFRSQRRVISNAASVPFADDVPDDVRPYPNPFITPALDMGFLRGARDDGRLDPSRQPLQPELTEELRVRLGLVQRAGFPSPAPCQVIDRPLDLTLRKGDEARLATSLSIVGIGSDGTRSDPVVYLPANGARLTVELPELHVEVRPPLGVREAQWCGPS